MSKEFGNQQYIKTTINIIDILRNNFKPMHVKTKTNKKNTFLLMRKSFFFITKHEWIADIGKFFDEVIS